MTLAISILNSIFPLLSKMLNYYPKYTNATLNAIMKIAFYFKKLIILTE